MKIAMTDKLHQPYRSRLVPGFDDIITDLKDLDIIGTVLSGAGPSILVVSESSAIEELKSIVKSTWENIGIKSEIKTVEIDTKGAIIL